MNNFTSNLRGVSFLVLAMLIMSMQGIAVKWIGSGYSVMEIVLFRSLVAIPASLLLFRMEGGRGLPVTRQPVLETARGVVLFLSYTTAFMGIAALPLAEVEAIRFSAPLMITILSVFMLSEHVSLPRWVALIIGFGGVLLVVRPGAATFNLGSVFILLSVLFYALNVILTRKLRTTDSSATMAYYSSLVYMLAAVILVPLGILIGETPDAHPSIAFLLRGWATPTLSDLAIMAGLGLVWAGGMYFNARAYSAAPASVIAPFEYTSLPINMMWGFLLFQEVPTPLTIGGALLTMLCGVFILYREKAERPPQVVAALTPATISESTG